MLAPQPRSRNVVYREIIPGFLGFDCTALRATLSPSSCAANWRAGRDGSACRGCRIGATHAGLPDAPPPPTCSTICCRCGRGVTRVIGGCLCVSCFNRARECIRQENRKGLFPWRTGDILRKVVAAVRVENANSALATVFASKPSLAGKTWSSSLNQDHKPGTPCLTRCDAEHVWLEAVVSGANELDRIIERLLPGGVIVASDFQPTFSDQWTAAGAVRLVPRQVVTVVWN